MKVALELQPCCGKRSGIGTYVYELARHLKNQDGLEFVGNLFNFRGREDTSSILSGVTMPIRENRLFAYGVYRRLWDLLPLDYGRAFPGGADLTVFFNYVVPPRGAGKVMTTIHDMTYLRFPETVAARNLRRLNSGVARSVEQSERILTVSEFSKREIVELLGVSADKVSVVYNAPSVAGGAVTARKYAEPYILYLGTIEPRKNLVRLIRAFELLKKEQDLPHKLIIAGGNGWNYETIYRAAEKCSASEEIIFTGYVGDEDKKGLYQYASAFVFPSLYEGFGIPPLEAMTFGCPVVVSSAASLPEVVGDAAELVDPLDEISIAQGIFNLLSDQSRTQTLIKRGRRQVKKYTWAASANKLTEICRMVLGES